MPLRLHSGAAWIVFLRAETTGPATGI